KLELFFAYALLLLLVYSRIFVLNPFSSAFCLCCSISFSLFCNSPVRYPDCQFLLKIPPTFVFICIEMSAIAKKGKDYVKPLIGDELNVLSLRHNGK
ncbi:MAG: hypothetical protein ACW7DU_10270, partial [Paraglaciecola chathamensis]